MQLKKIVAQGLCLPVLCVVAASVVGAQPQAQAPAQSALWGPGYQPVPAVAPEQAQVVLFREASSAANVSVANVYVDGGFHAALLPQGYTRFCLAKGTHALEAYVGDAPRYAGKFASKTQVRLEGGKTYFVGVSENGSGEPVPFTRVGAETLLAAMRVQRHVLSRAGAVEPCKEEPATAASPAPKKARYTLSADLLFVAGKGDYGSLTAKGREELDRLARQLQAQSIDKLLVRGHADAMGSVAGSLKLSEARARTVGRFLKEAGVASERGSAVGVGSLEPAVSCPTDGPKAARASCNAPNRRIEVAVETAPNL